MTELLILLVAGLVVIAGASVVGPRLGIASPLVLVGIGVAASFLPVFSTVTIDPELILAGILPPLLYSSAVSMPAMNFRREFGAISGLSVLLVVGTSLVLGLFFLFALPDLGFAWGVALGAIISPTDAVATSIIKRTQVSKRVVAILDGESLLNDATALVLLRTAIAATAASFSFWGAVGTFAYSVVAAVLIGAAIGWLNLAVRKRLTNPSANTVISFTVPFIAAVPAELLGASGLVAAVVAGIVTGIGAPRVLSPQNRVSDSQNWRTVELVLEGAVFLAMGLQIREIVVTVENEHAGVVAAVLVAMGALVVVVLVRALYVAPLLGILAGRARRGEVISSWVQGMHDQAKNPDANSHWFGRAQHSVERLTRRLTRLLADVDYLKREPLGWREGTVVVWAGMRGAVTVAAAQTLPLDTPQRSVLVLVAFSVAMMSLLVQGATVAPLVKRLTANVDQSAVEAQTAAEWTRISELLKSAAETVTNADRSNGEAVAGLTPANVHRLAVIAAQRSALLDVRDTGTFDADVLARAFTSLDAAEIAIRMRGRIDD